MLGGSFGGVCILICIVSICCTVLTVCLRKFGKKMRSENAQTTRVASNSANVEIAMPTLGRVPPTNPKALPPYVPSEDLQSSAPPPWTADPVNGPLPISVGGTLTPQDQPLPTQVLPSHPNDEGPPEYLPPPGSGQEDRQQLIMAAEQ